MTKKKKKKEKNNLLAVVVGIIAIIAIIAGSTYAYWTWSTNNSTQQTLVNIEVKGATLTITGNNIDSNADGEDRDQDSEILRPTNDCTSDRALIGEATVEVVNSTGTKMRATPRLDITLTPSNNRTFDTTASNPDLSHLHWALVDISSDTTKTCDSPDYQGTFNAIGKVTVSGGGTTDVSIVGPTISTTTEKTLATFNITNMSMKDESITNKYDPTNYQIDSTLSFVADAATADAQGVVTDATTTRTYRLYIWLDSTYAHNNVGDSVTDPMQDLHIKAAWSTKSTLIQE